MRVVFLRGACGNGRTCPNINSTDRESYVVQGYIVAAHGLDIAPGEAIVEVPLSLLPELSATTSRDGLVLTDRHTVLVRGTQVTDSDVLAELNMPAGENAVEILYASLPELEVAHAG